MAAKQLAKSIVISELVDSDDERETRGKTRNWIRRRGSHGYFNNIIQELKIEDRTGFRNMFRMTESDFEKFFSTLERKSALK